MRNLLVKLNTITLCALFMIGCQADGTLDSQVRERSEVFSVTTATTRTSLGDEVNECYPVYWSEGDCIAVNGVKSHEAEINADDKTLASFSVEGTYGVPYNITYPYCTATTASAPKVVFQSEQLYTEGSFAPASAPMYGYSESASLGIQLRHLTTILRFPVMSDDAGIVLDKIVITSTNKIAGEFAVDCRNGALTASDDATNSVTYTLPSNFALPTTEGAESVFYISLPAVEVGDCRVEFIDSAGGSMIASWSGKTLTPGVVRKFSTIEYSRGTECSLRPLDSEFDVVDVTGYVVHGHVKDTDGNPIAGVAVSDGFTVVATDENGFYTMDATSDTWYIFISLPSEYEVPINEYGQPCFYQRYDKERKVYDFELKPLAGGKEEQFALFALGDPQVSNSSVKLVRFKNEAVPAIKKHCTEVTNSGIPCYAITLGDIISNSSGNSDEYLRDDMRNGFAYSNTGLPVFHVMGNHDYTYCDASNPIVTDEHSSTLNLKMQRNHEDMFGPVNYSFNRGDVHIIGMKNIVYKSATAGSSYGYGFSNEQYRWLKQDLSLVPKDKAVVLCVHSPMISYTGNNITTIKNLLNEYNDVHIISGHTHINRNYEYAEEGHSSWKIYEHNVGALCGAWWNSNLCGDGTPNGYQVFIGGNDAGGGKLVDWYLMGCNAGMNNRKYQMRLYRGNAVTGIDKSLSSKPESSVTGHYAFNYSEDVLLANVYNADRKWVVKVYEDGVYSGDMECITTYTPSFTSLVGDYTLESPRRCADDVLTSHDMYVAGLFLGVLGQYNEETGETGSGCWRTCSHMYKYTLKNKDASIKVEATDRFGNVYTETTITEGTDYTLVKYN